MATRDYQFIVGPETSTLPTVTAPVADGDIVTLGYANTNYARRSSWFESKADATAVKAIVAADRADNQLVYVDSLSVLFKFDSASTQTGDDINVITPTAGTGRWLRLPEQVQVFTNDAAFVTFKAAAAAAGDFYYSSGSTRLKYYDGSAWVTLASLNAVDSLSNKTLDNTCTVNIKDSNLVIQDNADATRQARFETSTVTAGQTRVLTVPDADTTLVGTGVQQTLTAKTFGDPVTITQVATPSNPSAGLNKIYTKSDDKAYILSSSGVETKIGAGLSPWALSTAYVIGDVVSYEKQAYIALSAHTSSAVSFEVDVAAGGKWSLLNTPQVSENLMLVGNNFEDNDISGWTGTGCATVTNGLPVSVGSGGNPFSSSNGGRALGANTSAPAVTGTNPINGAYSLLLATTGAGTIGDGYVSQAYPVTEKYRAQVLSFRGSYKVVSGTPAMPGTSANTYAIAVYDVTNNAWLGAAGTFNFVQSNGVGTVSGTFQTAITTAKVQLFIYSPIAPTGASSLMLDDFYIGPQTTAVGPAMTDWVAYTPTYTGFGTVTTTSMFWRRVGDSIELAGGFTAGTTTAVEARVSLPSGFTSSDTSKIGAIRVVGEASINASSATYFGTYVTAEPSVTYVTFTQQGSTYNNITKETASFIAGAGALITLNAKLPIQGWSSNSSMSSDSDTRVVASRYTTMAGQSIANATTAIVDFGTVDYDLTGSVTTGAAWKYTAPVSGKYKVSAKVTWATGFAFTSTNALRMDLYKNGSYFSRLHYYGIEVSSSSIGRMNIGSDEVSLNAGDYVDVRVSHDEAATKGLATIAGSTSISIERLSGPATIASSESVSMRATRETSTQTLSASSNTVVIFNSISTQGYSSHSAYNTSTGVYTVPISGKYRVTYFLQVAMTGTFSSTQVFVRKNTANRWAADYGPNATVSVAAQIAWRGTDTISCVVGDTIDVLFSSGTQTNTLQNGSSQAVLTIERVGN